MKAEIRLYRRVRPDPLPGLPPVPATGPEYLGMLHPSDKLPVHCAGNDPAEIVRQLSALRDTIGKGK